MIENHIEVHNDAVEDLQEIKNTNPDDFFRLVALIKQLKTDRTLQSKLLESGFGKDRTGVISVKQWMSVQYYEKYPVWRLRAWELEREGLSYRLIYFYYWREKSFNIMAVVHRGDLDYDDPNYPIRKRIISSIKKEFPDG